MERNSIFKNDFLPKGSPPISGNAIGQYLAIDESADWRVGPVVIAI